MKALLFGFGLLFSLNALASVSTDQCIEKAGVAVEKYVAGKGYDKNGVSVDGCGVSINNAIILCEASASKGNGAAIDTYRVILNYACTKVYRVELMFEE